MNFKTNLCVTFTQSYECHPERLNLSGKYTPFAESVTFPAGTLVTVDFFSETKDTVDLGFLNDVDGMDVCKEDRLLGVPKEVLAIALEGVMRVHRQIVESN